MNLILAKKSLFETVKDLVESRKCLVDCIYDAFISYLQGIYN